MGSKTEICQAEVQAIDSANNSYEALLLKYYHDNYSSIEHWEKKSNLISHYLAKSNGNFAPVILQCWKSSTGRPTATANHCCCWTAAGYIYVFGCVCLNGISDYAQTQRLPPPVGQGGVVSFIPLSSYSGGGLAGRTAAAGSRWDCW